MTNRTQTLTTLATRAEQAGVEEQFSLLNEAVDLLRPHPGHASQWHEDFRRMVWAMAFTDAAMMLVPEGCFWSITMRGENRGGFHACCQFEGPLEWREAATPALALLAAICKAVAQGEG